ncbi:helix-turn-helix domain-containing protein, partial [Aquabacterium sp. A7-Y]|uniref:helix-turn-helix domain-containing protein n=1 Tax=Aquabacterium sp. A7-Y TaxID=1349605 RepID=UPI00223C9943
FVLHTRRANLSGLMQRLNGIYTQGYNRRHGKVGHVLQGRFKAILVDRDSYLLEVCRYVELNPVRAGLVEQAGHWPWSSYRAHCLQCNSPPWLDTDGLHGYVLAREASTLALKRRAARRYADLVAAARDVRLWEQSLQRQIYLGNDDFVARMQVIVAGTPRLDQARDIAKVQRRSEGKTLRQYVAEAATREEAMWLAHARSGLTMTQIGEELGLSTARVSQLIKRYEQGRGT